MIKCVNANILATANLLAARDPDAIVIFMSDHGSSALTEFTRPIDTWTDEQIQERFASFLAIHLPSDCANSPIPLSVVNVMETVFACLEGRSPRFLPDRYFIGVYEHNPDYGRVREIPRPDAPSLRDRPPAVLQYPEYRQARLFAIRADVLARPRRTDIH